MNSVYILIMVVGGFSSQSGLTTITAEFANFKLCEAARVVLEKQAPAITPVRMQGCFSKSSEK